jgi:AraC family transcriptional regulator
MGELNVRIESLPSMWVASVVAVGESPEAEAWRRLREWAVHRGLWSDFDKHPIFGFNNPSPPPGRKEYGYELWIRVEKPEAEDDSVAFKQFEGGLFAVTPCRLHGSPDVPTAWRSLWNWAQSGPYRWRRSQELEKVLNPDAEEDELVLELYLPVEPLKNAPAAPRTS